MGFLQRTAWSQSRLSEKLCISLLSHAWYLCLLNSSIQSSLPRLSMAEIALVLWLPVRLIFLHCFPFHGLPELQDFLRKQCEQGSLPAWCGKLNCRFNLSTPQAALKILFSKLWKCWNWCEVTVQSRQFSVCVEVLFLLDRMHNKCVWRVLTSWCGCGMVWAERCSVQSYPDADLRWALISYTPIEEYLCNIPGEAA